MVLFGSTDTQKTGMVLTALGCLFMFLGMLLFFDGGLLACVPPFNLRPTRSFAPNTHARARASYPLPPPAHAHNPPAHPSTHGSIGNLLLFTGITLILGVARTLNFFNPFIKGRSTNKIRGTVCIAIGVAMLLLRRGWSSIAFLIEGAWGGNARGRGHSFSLSPHPPPPLLPAPRSDRLD
jgi:hypothetical protein